MSEKEKKFRDLLSSFDNAMLITVASDGQIHARPMAIADVESDETIYFVSSSETGKMDEIQGDARVGVTCQSSNRFLSLSGTAQVEQNKNKIKELWKESWKVWFPEGPDSPEIRLIKVKSTVGEFWDEGGWKSIQYLYKAGKAYASGSKPEVGDDMHAKVDLH